MKSIDKKWAIRRNKDTYREINEYFAKLNNRSYSATGRWSDDQGETYHDYDFLVFPKLAGTTVVKSIPKGYEEVTWEWFQENILKTSFSEENSLLGKIFTTNNQSETYQYLITKDDGDRLDFHNLIKTTEEHKDYSKNIVVGNLKNGNWQIIEQKILYEIY